METPPANGPALIITLSSIAVLIAILIMAVSMLSSCQYLPAIAEDIKEIANDDAITIKCDKDCFSKSTDVRVSVEVINKDKP